LTGGTVLEEQYYDQWNSCLKVKCCHHHLRRIVPDGIYMLPCITILKSYDHRSYKYRHYLHCIPYPAHRVQTNHASYAGHARIVVVVSRLAKGDYYFQKQLPTMFAACHVMSLLQTLGIENYELGG
jgi:hypothetical protein